MFAELTVQENLDLGAYYRRDIATVRADIERVLTLFPILRERLHTPGGLLSRVKVVDPSYVNWPAVPVALADTIVPDFPLANKSFNQSYAGNDL